jgi:regulator of protease activity HflC (stomatin/prohibitin superfamily)
MVDLSSFVFGIVLVIAAFIVFLIARKGGGIPGKPAMSRVAKQVGTLAALGLGLLGIFTFGSSFVRVVPANSIGIPTTFGKIGSPLASGIHLTAPWTEITPFSTRIQELSMLRASDEGDKSKDDSVTVIALGGGSMAVDVTVRFALASDKAGELFKQAGTLQLVKDRFVRPDAREVVRNVFGQFSAEEGYSTKRAIIATKVTDELKPRLESRGILVDSVNIRDVAPDQQQLAAINAILQSRNEAKEADDRSRDPQAGRHARQDRCGNEGRSRRCGHHDCRSGSGRRQRQDCSVADTRTSRPRKDQGLRQRHRPDQGPSRQCV